MTVNLTDVNEAPVVSRATFSLPENSLPGVPVGTVTAIDPESGMALTLAITAGNTRGAFAINNLGQITVAPQGVLDFETYPTFTLTVEATDSASPALTGTGIVTVNLSNVNEAALVSNETFTVDEYSLNGAVLGKVTIVDPESLQTHTFAITDGDPDGAFSIDSSGIITVADTSQINFTDIPTYSLKVEATDNGSPAKTGSGDDHRECNQLSTTPRWSPRQLSVSMRKFQRNRIGHGNLHRQGCGPGPKF